MRAILLGLVFVLLALPAFAVPSTDETASGYALNADDTAAATPATYSLSIPKPVFDQPQQGGSGRFIVHLKKGSVFSEGELRRLLGQSFVGYHGDINVVIIEPTAQSGALTAASAKATVSSALGTGSDLLIESVEEDRLFHALLADSVPMINASYAYSSGYNGSGVKVCILDTGIDYFSTQLPVNFVARDFTYDWCIDGGVKPAGYFNRYKWNVTSSINDIQVGLWWVEAGNNYYAEIYNSSGSLIVNVTNASGTLIYSTINVTPGVYDVVMNWKTISLPDYPTFLWGSNVTNATGYYGASKCVSTPNPVSNNDTKAFYNNHSHSDDSSSHGAHVAGTIAKLSAPQGVSPNVTLYIGKVLASSGSGPLSEIINGIQWCIDNNASIVSMSLGMTAGSCNDSLVTKVEQNAQANLFVIAAGNDGPTGSTINSPGCAKNALTVGAVNKSNALAGFSSRGPSLGQDGRADRVKPDVTAPGVSINSTISPNTTGLLNGTSMATPHVAGAAALLKQRYPSASAQLLRALLIGSTDLADCDNNNGCGMINVGGAFTGSYILGSGSATYVFSGPAPRFTIVVQEPYTVHNATNFTLTVDDVQKDSLVDPLTVGRLANNTTGVMKVIANGTGTYYIIYANTTVQTSSGGNGTNGSVSGFALNITGGPINNSTVFINTTGFSNNTTSAANGFYVFTNLNYSDPATLYSIRAQHPSTGNYSNYTQRSLNSSSYNFTEVNLTIAEGGAPPPSGNGTNGSVSGFIRYSNNSTVSNASVFLNMTGIGLINATNSSANGSYSFTSLNYSSIGVQYILYATKDGNSSVPDTVTINTSAYTVTDRNISIITGGGGPPPGGSNGSISGIVYMPFGGPAFGANVSLMGPSSSTTLTNGSGAYSFANLSWPSFYGVQARMDNKVSSFINVNMSSATPIVQDINLTDQGSGESCSHNGTYAVSGYVRVVNESGPSNITGTMTQVELKTRNATCSAWDPSCFYAANQSNLSGFYTIGCLEAGNYSMMAFGGGGPGQQGPGLMMQPTNISITNASITGFDLNLTRDERGPQGCGGNASITGYVTTNNSGNIQYLSSVQVFAGLSDNSGGQPGQGGNFCGGGAQTDSNGLYNITGLRAGAYMLNVMPSQGSGYGEVHLDPSQGITLSNNSSTYERNFTLSRSGFVIGYVYGNNSSSCAASGANCAPLMGAFVNIYSPTPGGAWGGAGTNSQGMFNISITPGNSYELNVNPPSGSSYSTYRVSPNEPGGVGVNVTSGATTNLSQSIGAIILRQGASITGRVMNSTGQGIQNVGVNAHPKNMFGPGGEWGFSQTDSNGSFSISGLKANSTYIVEAFPFDPSSNYSTGSAEVILTDAGATVNITLVQGNSVSGRVTCNGSNVSFAQVNFMKVDTAGLGPDKMFGSMEAGSFAFAMADQNGLYSARGLSAGNFSLRAELPFNSNAYNCSANTTTVAISGPTEINVTLPSAVILSGRINDSNGNNVSNAFVNAFQPSTTGGPGFGPSAFAMSDSNGNYQLRVSTGVYVVSVFPPWGSSFAQQEVRMNITSPTTRNFTLTSGGSIRGKVVDSSGTAIQFASVNAFSETAHSFGFSNTQSDGTFEVRGLSAANDFRLFIQPPPNSGGIVPTFLENIAVQQGQATDVGTINATSATSYLLVTVVEGTTPISSANVHAWMPSTPYFGYCTTNSTGECNITGLAAGTYDVFVDSSGRPPRFANKTVAVGANSLTFNYSAVGSLYSLNGTVQNSTGGAIAGADVGIWDEGTRFGMHTTANGSGFFSFSGIPSGTYKLGARKAGYFDSMGSAAISSNATQNIMLSSASASGFSLITVSGWLNSLSNSSVATKSVVIVDVANASLFSDFAVTNSSGYYAFTSVPALSNGTINYKVTAVMGNQTFDATQAVSAIQNYTVNVTVS